MRTKRWMMAALLSLAPVGVGAQATDRVALVVGVTGYPAFDSTRRLRFADRDAQEFAAFLRSPQGGAFPAANVRVLTNQNAHRTAILDSLASIRRTIKPGAVMYVFFSGHTSLDANGYAYLMPYNADPASPSDKGWRINEFHRELSSVGAQYFILFLDACHSGAVENGGLGVPVDDVDPTKSSSEVATKLSVEWKRALERHKSQDGVIFSSSASQSSYEDPNVRHGLFAHYLLKGLRGGADSTGLGDRDGTVTTGELLSYLRDSVQRRALQMYRRNQTPDMTQALSSTFPLAKYVREPAPGRLFAKATSPPVPLLANATSARTHFDEGYRLAEAKDHAGAVREYRLALTFDANYTAARNNLGVALVHLGDSAAAIAEYRETVRRAPWYVLAHGNLSSHLARRGDTTGALFHLRQALYWEPRNSGVYSDIGNILRAQGQLDSARYYLRRAFTIDSLDAWAWHRYGQTEAQSGNVDMGILFESHGLSLGRRDPAKYSVANVKFMSLRLATLLAQANDLSAAEKTVWQAPRDKPSDSSLARTAKSYSDRAARLRDSVSKLRMILAASPENRAAMFDLHTVLHERQLNRGDALTLIEDWLRTHPTDRAALENRAENYFTMGRHDEASVALSQLLDGRELTPSNRVALTAIAVANDVARKLPAGNRLSTLERLVDALPDSTRVDWIFYGTRAKIRHAKEYTAAQRDGLLWMVYALAAPTKREMVERMQTARSFLASRSFVRSLDRTSTP
jgi:tetratricopeptide (TPR) repeat protein